MPTQKTRMAGSTRESENPTQSLRFIISENILEKIVKKLGEKNIYFDSMNLLLYNLDDYHLEKHVLLNQPWVKSKHSVCVLPSALNACHARSHSWVYTSYRETHPYSECFKNLRHGFRRQLLTQRVSLCIFIQSRGFVIPLQQYLTPRESTPANLFVVGW